MTNHLVTDQDTWYHQLLNGKMENQPHGNSPISCAVIAGGQSSRFGSDKALAAWTENRTVLGAVLEAASAISNDVFIVAGAKNGYREFGVPVYKDIIPSKGPVGGIHTALSLARGQRVLILACDMPAASVSFIRYLCKVRSWAPVIVPESDFGLEPLHALWHKSLKTVLEHYINQGSTGVRKILKDLPLRMITMDEAKKNGLDINSLKSTNTPEELRSLRHKHLII